MPSTATVGFGVVVWVVGVGVEGPPVLGAVAPRFSEANCPALSGCPRFWCLFPLLNSPMCFAFSGTGVR